ncbi:SDR family oxidoreductase [Spongiibacter nanhainus]|uniref:SDR family oxidoreductase n=1 Tax=Spongiibacter nanhainus TaxID=2794344 RepID=A0A7T4QYQ5_9GAMM|nr:SDR family NAD(P)-dependent oxidoreductase [Spongiibacter nanhainus]QQD17230.1 SDR family oxidoreductase [Spongiibacter nanhainus]
MTSQNKVAVVTGGASGIGAAICRALAEDGMDIAIWDLNEAAMTNVAADLEALGRRVVCSKVNVADRASVEAAAEQARNTLGPVTVLVNSAGVHATGALLDLSDEEWNRVININLNGTFICTQVLVPDMVAANWGRIINISSSSTQTGSPNMSHYVASKAGVIGFTKALAVELGGKGITVNNVPPGSVDTPMLRDLEAKGGLPGGVEAIAARNPVKRIGQPEDMAAAVAFLASDKAGYITGHTLSVNGGRYFN